MKVKNKKRTKLARKSHRTLQNMFSNIKIRLYKEMIDSKVYKINCKGRKEKKVQ